MIYIHSYLGFNLIRHYFYDEASSDIFVVFRHDDGEKMYCLGNINTPDSMEEYYKDYNLPSCLKYIEYGNRNDFKDSLLDYILDNI